MRRLLFDSDVLIDVLRGVRAVNVQRQNNVAVSVVTRCELFAGRSVDEMRLGRWLDDFQEIEVDRAIAEMAGRLRRRNVALETPDALVAATALHTSRELVTRNRRHFEPIVGLTIAPPEGAQ